MEIFRSLSRGFLASFSGVLDWIVLILVWFERSLHFAQVSEESCPWPLKLMTSQRVERTWIRKGGYGRFRGEWVKMKWWRESKKSNSLTSKTTTLHVHHAFLHISLPSLHDYHVKMPNFTFCEGRKQAMTKFSFSLWTWIWLIEIQLQKSSLAFDKVSELE